jgi:hypothetical protein
MEFRQWLIRNIGISLILILLIIVLIFLLGGDISGRADKIVGQRQDLAARIDVFDSLVSLRADVKRAEELSADLHTFLLTKDQLINFSETIENFAKNNQMDLNMFEFGSETVATETNPGVNDFTMIVSGSYPNFTRFLKNIEESHYFVRLDLLDLNQKENKFEISMRGKVFSQ